MASEDDPYSIASLDVIGSAGVRAEVLTAEELARRYPQMRIPAGKVFGIFEPDSGALMARRAVAAVVKDAVRQGVTFRREAVTPAQGPADSTTVFACGAWLPKLFPSLLANRIFPTRQEVFFFAPPAGDPAFGLDRLPVWIDFTHPQGPYGFPDLESRGCKLAFDRHGASIDPDSADRRVSAEAIAAARAFMAERFPAMRDAPLTETRVCQYENTSNGDFLIDRHPEWENIWLVGGGSGHGFKHGPAVGEYAAAQIVGEGEAEPRFSLATKMKRQERTVH